MNYLSLKKPILITLLIFLANKNCCYSQLPLSDSLELLRKIGMEFKTTENIRFLISKTSVKKPLIIFIRGSDFAPPFVNNMYNVFPFDIEEYKDKFNLVLLLKPGIPIFSDSLSNKFINETYKNGYYLDNNAQVPNEFIKNNNLYYYRNAIDIIIKHLKKEKYVDKEKIFLIGHSQGANVAISTALKNKKIKKIALLSTHIGDRFSEQIKKIRFKENNLNISHESAQLEIDSLYKTYVQLSKDKFNNQKLLV